MGHGRGDELLGVNIAFFVLAASAVLLRCYTRCFISRAFGGDDWLMVAACVSLDEPDILFINSNTK